MRPQAVVLPRRPPSLPDAIIDDLGLRKHPHTTVEGPLEASMRR